MARKLKVYRTPIGFHDAYVAALSQKAALEAWGSDVDLFGRGVAEIVTDEALREEPLKKPGEVVRKLRGSADDHFEALEKAATSKRKKLRKSAPAQIDQTERGDPSTARAKSTAKSSQFPPKPTPEPKPKPESKPSRATLDRAEVALEQARRTYDEAIVGIRAREAELVQQRRELERRFEKETAKLETAIECAQNRYRKALEKWAR